jgi:hypothetical protein
MEYIVDNIAAEWQVENSLIELNNGVGLFASGEIVDGNLHFFVETERLHGPLVANEGSLFCADQRLGKLNTGKNLAGKASVRDSVERSGAR